MAFCLFSLKRGFERAFFHFQENPEQIWKKNSEVCSFLPRKTFTKFQTVSCSLCRTRWESLLSIGSAFFVSPILLKRKDGDAHEENHIQCSAQSQHNYKPMQVEVKKVIPLYGKRFEQMKNHPLDMFSVRENTSTQYRCLQRENFMFSVMTTGKIAVSFRWSVQEKCSAKRMLLQKAVCFWMMYWQWKIARWSSLM